LIGARSRPRPSAPEDARPLRERLVWPERVVTAVHDTVPGFSPQPNLRPLIDDAAAQFLHDRVPSVASSVCSDGINIIIRPRQPRRRPLRLSGNALRVIVPGNAAGVQGGPRRTRKSRHRPTKTTRMHTSGSQRVPVPPGTGEPGNGLLEPAVNRVTNDADASSAPAVASAPVDVQRAVTPPPPCCERGTYTMCVHQEVLDFEPSDEDEPTLAELFSLE
jgi:hypothetical protein